jgi:hypothetical protein
MGAVVSENGGMEANKPCTISNELMADLLAAAATAARGVRDPEEMRKACEEMDRIREANRRKLGTRDVGVSIIREMRDAE